MHLAKRAATFLRWLMARPEQHIAVVTHSSWLSVMCSHVTGECSVVRAQPRAAAAAAARRALWLQQCGADEARACFTQDAGTQLKRWFNNAEVRAIHVRCCAPPRARR